MAPSCSKALPSQMTESLTSQLPVNFLIVGAAKSGTTALATILSQHPEVFVARRKESHYLLFDGGEPDFAGPGDDAFVRNVVTDRTEYEGMFAGAGRARAIGEASVFYMYRHSELDRIAARLPGAKAIAILREPTDRALSAYRHMVRDGREDARNFEEALSLEPRRQGLGWEYIWRYRDVGLYARQIEALFTAFGRDRVLVLRYDDLRDDPEAVLQSTFSFLDVDPDIRVDVGVRTNQAGVPRSRGIHRVLTEPHRMKDVVRPLVPDRMLQRTFQWAFRTNLRPAPAPERAVMRSLARTFRDDVTRLERVSGLDLGPWIAAHER